MKSEKGEDGFFWDFSRWVIPGGDNRRGKKTRPDRITRKQTVEKWNRTTVLGFQRQGGKHQTSPASLEGGGGDGVGVGGVMSRNDELVSNWILMSA